MNIFDIEKYNATVKKLHRFFVLDRFEGQWITLSCKFEKLGNHLPSGERYCHASINDIVFVHDNGCDYINHMWLQFVARNNSIWNQFKLGDNLVVGGWVYIYDRESGFPKTSLSYPQVLAVNGYPIQYNPVYFYPYQQNSPSFLNGQTPF